MTVEKPAAEKTPEAPKKKDEKAPEELVFKTMLTLV